ncbi:MAG TPA: heme o synthase [Pseudomonadales bacterium]|jgi:protoheme IX farnesyltransferase|nr:heme o synthase [Pseudomonadales bacterium]HMW14980.1 heme o synthase [Pseudomonadales bacterium]HMW82987.1 heme o synthase [Pseudomonadales bacterium]HMY96720.1 heme o synthase [Pseudomonadales bacterium]HMZ70455.1 heme o synthase [Pseudomonadales bacterium]
MEQAGKPIGLLDQFNDYLELCKPKVVALMILTSIVGMFLAVPGMVPWDVLLLGNLGIALVSASGAVINHVIDRRIDTLMARTHKRPVAVGRVSPARAMLFALLIGVVGMAILLIFVNPLCAWLTLAAFVGYAFIYTGYLKRATPQNIVIGGIAGAAPPLLGWSAVTGTVDPHALLLVLIIFAWTPPHFWALAIHRKEDYAKANIPMLPVTHGDRYTKLHILLYTAVLFAAALLPAATGMSGWIYLAGASLLGAGFIYRAVQLCLDEKSGAPMATFRYSILYLMALFVVLLVDHYFLIRL